MDIHKYAARNARRSIVFVMLSFILLGALISGITFYFIPGIEAAYIGVGVGVIIIALLYANASSISLVMSGAKEAKREDHLWLHNAIEEMVIASGISMPRVHIVEDRALNAFAAGTAEKGNLVFTRGILEALTREELQGVVAHEVSHLKNGDSKLMTIVASVGLAIGIISDIGLRGMFFSGGNRSSNSGGAAGAITLVVALVGIVLAPVLALLIQASISREREWLADSTAANITRNPGGLRSALEKLSMSSTEPEKNMKTAAHLWIAEPVEAPKPTSEGYVGLSGGKKKKKKRASIFSTHPPLEERITRLRILEGTAGK